MDKPICITFAGAVGSSRTPIAHHISTTFDLPIFNNDTIRNEVREDCLGFNEKEYEKRRKERLLKILASGMSFIYDASVDRKWIELKRLLDKHNYSSCVISLDLTVEFLAKIHKAKDYDTSVERLKELADQHDSFVEEFSNDVALRIPESAFKNRLRVSEDAVRRMLSKY